MESGVSATVQLISAIAGGLILFVFDTIFAEHHISQKNSKNAATRGKLEHILKVKGYLLLHLKKHEKISRLAV